MDKPPKDCIEHLFCARTSTRNASADCAPELQLSIRKLFTDRPVASRTTILHLRVTRPDKVSFVSGKRILSGKLYLNATRSGHRLDHNGDVFTEGFWCPESEVRRMWFARTWPLTCCTLVRQRWLRGRAQLQLGRTRHLADALLPAGGRSGGRSGGAAATTEFPSLTQVTSPEESNSGRSALRAALKPSAARYGLAPGLFAAQLKWGPFARYRPGTWVTD